MPRPATKQPNVFVLGVSINNEVTVGCLLVLTNAALDQRGIFQTREAESEIFTNSFQSFRTYDTIVVSRIEFLAPCVVRDLESSTITSGNPVKEMIAVVCPHGQMRVSEVEAFAPHWSEEEYVLFRGSNPTANRIRKELAHPWSASEYVNICRQVRSIG